MATKIIFLAGYYGISGASGDAAKRRENERLISLAIKRMLEFGSTPYILTGDFNMRFPGKFTVIRF